MCTKDVVAIARIPVVVYCAIGISSVEINRIAMYDRCPCRIGDAAIDYRYIIAGGIRTGGAGSINVEADMVDTCTGEYMCDRCTTGHRAGIVVKYPDVVIGRTGICADQIDRISAHCIRP
jgi:hypothetical protein